jgi:hypothetical protein
VHAKSIASLLMMILAPRHARPGSVISVASGNERPIGLKVFAVTKAREREFLGEMITDWIRTHPEYEVFDKVVTQSSDREFHCLAITLVFYVNKSRT